MCECCQPSSVAFFDSIASKWDSWEDIASLNAKFDEGLRKFCLKDGEHILDVGCGTGNLTAAILRHLSPSGRVTAIDLSNSMIQIAREKVNDPRVTWVCDAVEHLNGLNETFDRIICYSVWPHLTVPQTVGKLLWNLLRANGKLHIWHLISRDKVNKVHSEASAAVSNHLLVPAQQTATLLKLLGFSVEKTQDDDAGYLVTARKV